MKNDSEIVVTNCGGALRTAFHETLRDIPFRVRPGGVRTLIAVHHGCKTKSESFTSCRCRCRVTNVQVNISGDS